MDSFLDDSLLNDDDGSNFEFSPPPKAKAKAAPKPKKAAAPKQITKKTTTQTAVKPKTKAVTKAAPKKRARPDTEDEVEIDSDKDMFDDGSVLSSTPPGAKKAKMPPKKKAASKPLATLENDAIALDGVADEKPQKAGTATDRYQKLTQLEHIIKRPDTYIGSVERNEKQMWVFNSEKESMELREVSYVPGLYKIFDEILVNAADNKQNDKNMDTIRVTVNVSKGEISVWNNGRGIPIEIHDKEKIWIPEMIFGHLLTSSNYDDDEKKVTGGRNGYGAKLCNVFSTKFILETAHSKTKKKYKQTWTKNMSVMGEAEITAQKGEDYTMVTFYPDFAKFKMDGIDNDLEALINRRVYDMAGTIKGVKVYLNGERVKVKNFKEYTEMFTKAIKKERGDEAAGDQNEIFMDGDKNRWEVGFAVSDGSFQSVSFVNSIATTSGGTHVNYIADQITDHLMEEMRKKKNKEGGVALKPGQIRNHLFVFVNCQIENPAFTSQTKEQLTTKASQFGSKFPLNPAFLKKIVAQSEVMENIRSFARQKADQVLKKSDGNRRSRMDNPKLTDANKAGTKDGWQCTLILTEGDSAKGLAMTGRSIVGPDLFGVFPLRGKLLNVRDASVDQVSKNAEIQNIKNILGLKHKQVYTDCKSLRYGHIMIMTDQDHDGSHIKGLLINFLQVQYPSLLKLPKFLIEFITPIVKVYKGDPKNPTKAHTFFTIPEYEAWKEEHKDERGYEKWEHKYYKGLGTSGDEDAEKYFRDLDKHLKEFHTMQEKEAELLELAFAKKKADERKEWLRQFRPGTYLDHSTKNITYTDFVNKELILFSMADNMRSIPSIVDGFKPGQRKVLFTCLKRNLRKDKKLVELAGDVMGLTAYHHGDASLQQTIVGLAQTFVGSNNLNTLEPSGNFGSRLMGGSDSASARYIFTRLSPFARRVFHPLDDPLLSYLTDDNTVIEPETYVPVVPMILINGADGIGTGWSSQIPNYNPVDIVDNLKAMMRGEEPKPMTPWFRDFKGTIEPMGPDRFKCTGIAEQTGDNEVEISELPIRMWTQDFKDKLVEILKAEKTPSWIKDYDDYNTKQNVNFVIRMEDKHMQAALKEGLLERFKLVKTIATSNLVAFDAQGRITKYANVEEILKAFYDVRIKYYEKRKANQLAEMSLQLEKLTNQARFVQMIIDGKLVVAKRKKKDIVAELKEKNFKPFPKVSDATKDGEFEPAMEDQETDDADVEVDASAYDYLLGMAIWSLTKERVDKLLKQMGDKQMEIDELIKKTKEDLWTKDLDEFMDEWETQLADEKNRRKKLQGMKRRESAKLKTQAGGRKRKNQDSDDDFDVKKPKAKKAAAPKSNLLTEFVKPKPAPKPTVKKATQTAVAKVDEPDVWQTLDGASESDIQIVPKAAKTVPTKPPAEDIGFEDQTVRPTGRGRAARAAAKPVSYGISSDSDESDGDFDVSRMVKGIGQPDSKVGDGVATGAPSNSRQLFSANLSRPGSSAGLAATRKSFGRDKTMLDDNSADETDYTRLAPMSTGTTKVTAKTTVLSDDDDSMDLDGPAEMPPVASTHAAAAAAAASKKRGGATGAKNTTKTAKGKGPAAEPPKAKTAKKKTEAVAAKAKPAPKPAEKSQLSPAAKAYAAKRAKQAKTQTLDFDDDLDDDDDDEPVAARRRKEKDGDDDDVDKLADDMLSDEDEVAAAAKPAPAAAARPARRAAAQTKKAWIVDDDSDDDGMEDTMDFDDEDSD